MSKFFINRPIVAMVISILLVQLVWNRLKGGHRDARNIQNHRARRHVTGELR